MKKVILLCLLALAGGSSSSCVLDLLPCTQCDLIRNAQYRVRYPPADGNRTIFVFSSPQGCIRYDRPISRVCSNVEITFIGAGPRSFTAVPSSLNLQSPPATFTITGEQISSTSGMPMVQFRDEYAVLIDERPASAVASDGTWLQINTPDLSSAWSGQYTIEVANMMVGGGQEVIGVAQLETYGRDRPDADGDGWFADQDCNDNDPSVNPGASPDCSRLQFDRNCNGREDYWELCCDPRMECQMQRSRPPDR